MSSQMVSLDQPPAALERGAADQAHRAMHDDGIGLVALDHADVEETGIFAVHGVMERAARAVAMVLRAPGPARPWVGEHRHEVGSHSGITVVIGIDDADDFGVRGGVRHGRAGARPPCSLRAQAALMNLKRRPSVRQCSSTGLPHRRGRACC